MVLGRRHPGGAEQARLVLRAQLANETLMWPKALMRWKVTIARLVPGH